MFLLFFRDQSVGSVIAFCFSSTKLLPVCLKEGAFNSFQFSWRYRSIKLFLFLFFSRKELRERSLMSHLNITTTFWGLGSWKRRSISRRGSILTSVITLEAFRTSDCRISFIWQEASVVTEALATTAPERPGTSFWCVHTKTCQFLIMLYIFSKYFGVL